MPDFAPNVTPRYKLHYRAVGRSHTTQVRGARGASFLSMEATGRAAFNSVFNALAAAMPVDLAFLSAEVALTDSDVFVPAALPTAVVGVQALATYTKQDSITHLRFSGRGSLGAKVNLSVFGRSFNPDILPAGPENDFLITPGELADVTAAITALQGTSGLVAIDNSPISWRTSATIKVNDAWLRKVRQGL